MAITAFCLGFAGCGKSAGPESGGGGGGGTVSADFTLTLGTASLSIGTGQVATLTVSVTPQSGFASAVTLQIAGLPSGVTYSPSTLSVSPGTPLQITFSAAKNAAATTSAVNITGTSGSLTHSAGLSLTLQTVQTLTTRTRYVRTDAVTEYGYDLNSQWMVYDSPTNRFFVSDPYGNKVFVLSAATQKTVGAIPVPGAFTIDETPDHSTIYVATQIGDVYAIDPVKMQVTRRYLSSSIGPSGFMAYQLRVLANGELALLGAQGGIPGVDGYGEVAVWNPVNNSITVYGGTSQFCVRNIGAFTVTGDRSLIVTASIDSDGTLCTLDPVTGHQNSVASGREFVYTVAATPDGKSLLVPIYSYPNGQIAVFDVQRMAQTATLTVAGDTSSAASMIVSPDSSTLYMNGFGSGIVYAYSLSSGALLGWMSDLTVEPMSGGGNVGPATNPNLQAFDGSGLLAGPMEEGVGFLDTTTLRTGKVGAQLLNGYLTPATGPATGGTQVQFENLSNTTDLTAVYFAGSPASATAATSTQYYATTPSGNSGPADVVATMADGSALNIPEGFSYGPTILEVTPNSATQEGTGVGYILGYGFGSTAYNAPIPSGLLVTVGGRTATVTGFVSNAYNNSSPPFNLQALSYIIPPGVAGTSADVSVTTQAGTATNPGGFSYLPAIQQVPLSGASLAQGVYDPKRDVYYFTDATQIRVYSRTQSQWLTSIQVPSAPVGLSHRLWGVALSADASKLAVSDTGASFIYLINPDAPATAQSFHTITLAGVTASPAGVAVTNSGLIYYAASVSGGGGGVLKIDSTTGKVTAYSVIAFASSQLRVGISPDQTKAYFNADGAVVSIATATDALTYATTDPGCCYGDYDLTVSPSGAVEATSYLYDQYLNANSYLTLNDRESLTAQYVYGTKLSVDGRLLFQPAVNGIDIFDGRLGTLRTQISLSVALSQNYDALVSDGKDNILIAITGTTGTGIAVVDLSNLAEPPALPYLRTPDEGSTVVSHTPVLREASQVQASRPQNRVPIPKVRHSTSQLTPGR